MHKLADLSLKLKDKLQPPPINYATKPSAYQTSHAEATCLSPCSSSNSVFVPIGKPDVAKYKTQSHPCLPKSIAPANQSGKPIPTNKFYSNLYFGSQRQAAYVLPYTMNYNGSGVDIGHTNATQLCFGPDPGAKTAQYCFAPVGIVSLAIDSVESTKLRLSNADQFSIHLHLESGPRSIEMPLVTGMAFVSARYLALTPVLRSKVQFRSVIEQPAAHCQKWHLVLEDGELWIAYWFGPRISFQQMASDCLQASSQVSGLLQVAKVRSPAAEAVLDQSAGTVVESIILAGTAGEAHGSYTMTFVKTGAASPAMYALPHHVASFDAQTSSCIGEATLDSQVNGPMTLVQAESWTMHEALPAGAQLALMPEIRQQDLAAVSQAIGQDCQQDFDAGCRADSMYFGGKALAKLAQVTLLATQLNHAAASHLMQNFERNLLIYVDNQQQFPLVYDNTWGGLVSCQGFQKDPMADFGNTWYNDHMFHSSYHVFAAAVFLILSPDSPHAGRIRAYAEILLQDFMNPVETAVFPAFRNFDWFVGHSWAKGLFESADGKDEESSSEDAFATFAAYLYGMAAGLPNLASLARLMLAVQKRSMNLYMLFQKDNSVMPRQIIGNKVSGIRFQNKVDYATYFGANREYIHGIHMIPLSPISAFIRPRRFVEEEWSERVQAVSGCAGGWRGIIWANYALVDAEAAWQFFTCGFDRQYLDDGASLSWYLAFVSSLRSP
ncbi:endo-1,3(4)-beta-glucanase [Protomyces lactucae-debilis]|uniref:glucan endo-1,3-beta-D-glucosidase n=1 Tax=Protomyces lactucae-debilis TaxID=2754530 RepID=A0A1Y2EXD5_PROLT|nr:endo-1,3(4)-beta-glucanase [Protomyces lactucae-debilis]ORY75475.1 endo-1,3(4)-beta-glucanase [Protomyces lactucae-debilis]